jgi:hypothetical protein
MGPRGKSGDAVVGMICAALVLACNVYENDPKIDAETSTITESAGDTAKETAANGGGSRATNEASGSGSAAMASDAANSGDGSPGGDSSISIRPGAVQGCGDGLVGANETCDILIAKGKAGTCPRSDEDCPRGDRCVEWKFNGQEGCKALCRKLEPPCENGDDCCPSSCTFTNDSDCSSNCGDGVLQKERGEICERARSLDGRSLAEGIPVCPTKCADDGDPCTKEELSGSEANCNAVCTSVRVTELVAGDGCCPTGADTNKDSDCQPICGNKIREGNEECDGTSTCDAQCKTIVNAEQDKCVSNFNLSDITEDCKKCMCNVCPRQVLNCFATGNDVENAKCDKVIKCAYDTGCIASACYCGDATGFALGACLFGYAANGPCKSVIEGVGGTNVVGDLVTMQLDPNTPLGRAQAVSDCFDTQCKSACTRQASRCFHRNW